MPCDWAQFVKDISIPDGTVFQPGTAFTKTWRLRNIGTCTWTNNYSLVFDSGSLMGGPTTVGLTGNVLPGDLVDLSVNLIAPATDGNYQGNWKLRNAAGQTFGLGPAANQPFWVKITVKRSEQVIYDFTRDFCIANWHTAVTNMLLCPTPSESDTGFVNINPTPKLENNTTEDETALLTYPNQGNGGFITGYYPPMKITSGDHLKTVIGCIYGAVDCNVTFELSYSVSGGRPQTLGSWSEVYDGNIRKIDLDLSFLNGQTVQIVFNVYNNGDSADDQAFWLLPRITR